MADIVYASPEDLVERHDINVVGDLATDDRNRLARPDILAHPNVATALLDATGQVQIYLQRGKKYTVEQLDELAQSTDPALAGQRNWLKRIVTTVAMGFLFERRPGIHTQKAQAYQAQIEKWLKDLATGENVFGLTEEDLNAGMPTIGGLDPSGVDALNLLPNRAPLHRYFPLPAQRLPAKQGGAAGSSGARSTGSSRREGS